MLRASATLAAACLLAGCVLQPLKHSRQDVEAADIEFEFTLPDAAKYSAADLDAAERARLPEVDQQCAGPAADQLLAGIQRNLGGGLPYKAALTQARAVAALASKRMRECLERLGLVGGVYVVMPSGRVELPEYIDAIKAVADRQRQERSSSEWAWSAASFLGCGSRGGPGWRRADGQCAAWRDK